MSVALLITADEDQCSRRVYDIIQIGGINHCIIDERECGCCVACA